MAPANESRSRAGSRESEQLLQTAGSKEKAPVYDKASLKARWLILLLNSLALMGNYYVYDNPSALKNQLTQYFEGTQYSGAQWETYFAYLYTVYSIPNVILPFIGGYLVDRIGVRVMTMVFIGFIVAGQCVFAFGCSLKSIPIMLAGRVVFGFGGESLTVASSAILSYWFKDKELALALGINLGVSRLGGVANNYLSPIFWDLGHISLWIGAIICAGSLLSALLMISIDVAAEKKLKKANDQLARENKQKTYNTNDQTSNNEPNPKMNIYEDVEDIDPESSANVEEQVKITDVRHFGLPFWLLTASCLVVYGTVLPFNNIASTFLLTRDFMVEESPWKENQTFVAPICDSQSPDDSADSWMVKRSCGNTTNTYLGPQFQFANFTHANITTGITVEAMCMPGSTLIGNVKIHATCVAAVFDDSFSGSYWNITSGSGCAEAKKNCSIDHTDEAVLDALDYLHAEYKNASKGSPGAFVCKKKYCKIDRSSNETRCITDQFGGSPALTVTCDNATGVLSLDDDNNACVPVLASPNKYCDVVNKGELKANAFMSIPYFLSIVISPMLGYGVDRLGKRTVLATGASVCLIAVHMTLGFTKIAPYGPLVGQGLAYSVFAAALWPSVPYAVEQQYVGTAYGVMTAVQNGGLAAFPVIIAMFLTPCSQNPAVSPDGLLSEAQHNECHNTTNDYQYSELFFACLAGFGTLIGIWLYVDDRVNRGGVLYKSHMNKAEDEAKKSESINN